MYAAFALLRNIGLSRGEARNIIPQFKAFCNTFSEKWAFCKTWYVDFCALRSEIYKKIPKILPLSGWCGFVWIFVGC